MTAEGDEQETDSGSGDEQDTASGSGDEQDTDPGSGPAEEGCIYVPRDFLHGKGPGEIIVLRTQRNV